MSKSYYRENEECKLLIDIYLIILIK